MVLLHQKKPANVVWNGGVSHVPLGEDGFG